MILPAQAVSYGRRAMVLPDLITLVVAILSVSILGFALVTRTRAGIRERTCINNLKRLNQGVLLYAADHRQTLPAPSVVYPGDWWWWYKESIKAYVGGTNQDSGGSSPFSCPSDRGYTDDQPFYKSARFDFGSYVYNGVTLPGAPNISGWNLSRVRNPGRTLLVMEWPAHAPLSWHRSRTGRRNSPFYRDAEAAIGRVDGRVSMTPIYYDGHSPAYSQDPIGGYDYQYSGD